MSKRIKLNVLVIVVVLLFYVSITGLYFDNARENTKSDFYSSNFDAQYELYNASAYTIAPEEEGYINCKDAEEFIYYYCDGLSFYPYSVAIFDSNGNELARTGSYVDFSRNTTRKSILEYEKGYRCFIDRYLTDDIQSRLENAFQEGWFLTEFGFYSENDEFIPVYMLYEDGYGNETDRIVFSNHDAQEIIKTPNDTLYFNPVNIAQPKYLQKCVDYIENDISSGNALAQFKDRGTGEEVINDEIVTDNYVCWYFDELYINSEKCTLLYVSYIDINSYTLNCEDVSYYFKDMALFHIAAAAIALTLVNHYINKNKAEKAKYIFTNAIAHELKTPLAVIENQSEFILEGVNADKNLEYTKSIYSQTLRMSSLLNNLLRYNKLSSLSKIDKQKTELSSIINTELEKYASLAESKNISLSADLEETQINCNTELIALVIDNFISNAIKFSKENAEVKIILKNKKLSVINPTEKELSKDIWDMLYTEDEARGDKSTGMGLPISKVILQLHNYKYGLKNENGCAEFYFIAK